MYGLIFLLLFTLLLGFVSGWRYAKYESPKSLTERVRFGFAKDSDITRWVAPEKDLDCVCGQMINTTSAKPSVHDGLVYYFCSRKCRDKFETAPSTYSAKAKFWPL
jgi:YHS domain-containing protein